MKEAKINSITRLRIHADGQGVRSVVFMQDCPLNCFWCCNPETRNGNDFRTLTAEALYQYLKGDIPYFCRSGGGITFSGGEPLLQGAFLREFIEKYCEGFTVDVETSLYTGRDTIAGLIPLIHEWNIDFKICDESRHREYTGVSNRQIKENLRYLAARIPSERIIITYPIIPGYNDSDENIAGMMAFLKENGISRIELHPYRKFAEEKHQKLGLPFTEVSPIVPERYRHIRSLFQKNGFSLVQRETLYGKEKCAYLKNLRREFCESHGLSVEIVECTSTEDCIGTCPRCEYELAQIQKELQSRKLLSVSKRSPHERKNIL